MGHAYNFLKLNCLWNINYQEKMPELSFKDLFILWNVFLLSYEYDSLPYIFYIAMS